MEKTKHSHDETVIQTLGIDKSVRDRTILFLSIIIPFFLLLGGIFITQSDTWWAVFIFIPMLVYILGYLYLENKQQLLIYEDGIEHIYGSRRSFIPWEHIIRIERRSMGKSSATGIVTSEPIRDEIPDNVLARLLFTRQNKYFLGLSEMFEIPSKSDGLFRSDIDLEKLKDTDFGRMLYNYVPHIFEVKQK